MIDILLNFFYMGGYGTYVFAAYGIVFFYLFIQWLLPWRRWHNHLRTQKSDHEQIP